VSIFLEPEHYGQRRRCDEILREPSHVGVAARARGTTDSRDGVAGLVTDLDEQRAVLDAVLVLDAVAAKILELEHQELPACAAEREHVDRLAITEPVDPVAIPPTLVPLEHHVPLVPEFELERPFCDDVGHGACGHLGSSASWFSSS